MSSSNDAPRQLMAYFSHSYHPEDNRTNLYFWEMLSSHHLYFAVDPPSDDRRPMDVTYLEWLMEQSACFVAVIPRREDAPSPHCSPYQLFEYRLAVRARKPRLIFLQDDLDQALLGIDPAEVVPFRRRRRELDAFREEDKKKAGEFATRVRQLADERPLARRPIGLVTSGGHSAYVEAAKRLKRAVRDELGWSCRLIDASDFDSDYRLLQELSGCEVLVSEVRPPYIPPDLYGLIHGRSIPTIRIARLDAGESPDKASLSMRLALARDVEPDSTPPDNFGWPIVLRGYQVDQSMEPVVFWKDSEELCRRVVSRLRRITEPREDLDEDAKARRYFLRLGRLDGKVFISNFHDQNRLATRLADALRNQQAIRVFHYTDSDRDPAQPNWKDGVRQQIDSCTQFVALIDEGFNKSEWCTWEIEVAVDLFKEGRLELLTYKIGTDEVPRPLRRIYKHVQEFGDITDDEKVKMVVSRIVESFEQGQRVRLEQSERSQLIDILARQPGMERPENLRAELRDAGIPEGLAERVNAAVNSTPGLHTLLDALANCQSRIKPWKTPLGMFLVHATRRAEQEDRDAVWGIIRDRSLMPDVRLWVEERPVTRELCLAFDDSSGTVGTFEGIREGRLKSWRQLGEWSGGHALPGLLDLVSSQQDWRSWITKFGKGVISAPSFTSFQTMYREAVGPKAEGQGRLGICVASGPLGLREPIEWARFEGIHSPLALAHPVRRYLLRAPTPRPTLRQMLTQGRASPVRVLIAGANSGDLPWVDEELSAVRNIYERWFDKLGWPLFDLEVIEPGRLTAAQLNHSIRHGGYHLLHFAGHGLSEGDEPGLSVIDDSAKDRYVTLPASELAEWVAQSDLRLVYLSSCRSAGDASDTDGSVIRRFESLAEAMVHARVPEVVGFRWPILDRQGRVFAERFHDSYLGVFDASFATFEARTSFQTTAQIWAASLVISQHDSPPEP